MTSFAWLIEAPGQCYLMARRLGVDEFAWTQDHNAAIRFFNQQQADATMMAIRVLAPKLFDFESKLGDAKAIEHGWISLRRCQKCGAPTNDEEAEVDGQIWCHPCADTISLVHEDGK